MPEASSSLLAVQACKHTRQPYGKPSYAAGQLHTTMLITLLSSDLISDSSLSPLGSSPTRIHGAPSCSCAHHCVDLIDEEHNLAVAVRDLLEDGLLMTSGDSTRVIAAVGASSRMGDTGGMAKEVHASQQAAARKLEGGKMRQIDTQTPEQINQLDTQPSAKTHTHSTTPNNPP